MPSRAAAETAFYELPPATHAFSMTAGPEGAIWFAGRRAYTPDATTESEVVGRIDREGRVKVFDVPGRYLGQIVAGGDGNLWFTFGHVNRRGYVVGRIGVLSPAGGYDEYRLGNHVGFLRGLTAGPNGSVWFTVSYRAAGHLRGVVGRIDASGSVRRFMLPLRHRPGRIVAGRDGSLWFTERVGKSGGIGRITPAGRVTHFPLSGRGRQPSGLAVGPDGEVWFGIQPSIYPPGRQAKLARIAADGAITEFPLPAEAPYALVAGPAGRLWYTAATAEGPVGIGSIGGDGTATLPACVTAAPCKTDAGSLAVGPGGELWFAASTFYPVGGGGGTAIFKNLEKEAEAGLVGRYSP